MQKADPFITVRGTGKEEERRPERKTNNRRLSSSANSNWPEELCKSKGDQSAPEENYLGGQARTTRVDTPDSSSNNMIANSRNRVKGTDGSAIIFRDKFDTPNSKIDKSIMRVLRVGRSNHLISILEMSRKEERSIIQVFALPSWKVFPWSSPKWGTPLRIIVQGKVSSDIKSVDSSFG
ncbi:hypothetical protein TNIN_368221 [Trichonephila inaurata madagascariensis]|uniref:Uncharacterized protein n=1 Tax=Trichonephila inaurata madagascariensis TaxID=2747483 RepID=A0A8X6YVL0_9ARAC|nr:hypothetical protein TNIN_368221 [Trichonephila inaurata madagascariensis]